MKQKKVDIALLLCQIEHIRKSNASSVEKKSHDCILIPVRNASQSCDKAASLVGAPMGRILQFAEGGEGDLRLLRIEH